LKQPIALLALPLRLARDRRRLGLAELAGRDRAAQLDGGLAGFARLARRPFQLLAQGLFDVFRQRPLLGLGALADLAQEHGINAQG
jgi:hypothetical protein